MRKPPLVVALLSGFVLFTTWACPDTQAELEVKQYVEKRTKLMKDGSLAKQIHDGTYTADSLSLEMYQWWVQLGLANHAAAIESFVDMILDSGMPQQAAPSRNWAPLVEEWVCDCVNISGAINPVVYSSFVILQMGLLSFQSLAYAMADPAQGGSTNFLVAAEKWRSELPTAHTQHLIMVHDFINELKNNDTQKRLMPAYELVTQMINNTQSYRYLFNAYYAAYQQSIVPHNQFYFGALVDKKLPWSPPRVTTGVLWSPAPAGLDGCVIKNSVLEANGDCIDASTPVLGNFTVKALLINTVLDNTGFKTWSAYEFPCNNISDDSQIGCIDLFGRHYNPGEKNDDGHVVCTNWRLEMDHQTTVFEELRAGCASSFNDTSRVAAYNYVNFPDKPEYYDVTKFDSKSSFEKHTCRRTGAPSQSIVV